MGPEGAEQFCGILWGIGILTGGWAGKALLPEYYQRRGLSKDVVPAGEKLLDLGLI